MARLRHRKWYRRTALLAAVALLWSQFALASHADCLKILAPTASAEAMAAGHGHGCDAEVPPADKPLCDAHCAGDNVSTDSGRLAPVPPLFAGAWLPWFPVAAMVDGAAVAVATSAWIHSPPRPAWHRPTSHPAALLLI